MFFASAGIGVIFALASALLLKHVDLRKNPSLEFGMMLVFTYMPYALAEGIHLSGAPPQPSVAYFSNRNSAARYSPRYRANIPGSTPALFMRIKSAGVLPGIECNVQKSYEEMQTVRR